MFEDEKKRVRLDVEVVVESIVERFAATAPSLRRRRRELGEQLERACR